MQYIIKRDGRKAEFDGQKIMDAILKAFLDVDGVVNEYAEEKAYNIAKYIEDLAETKELTIEEIQDLVQKGLMSTKRKDVAESYVIYRYERTKIRNNKSASFKEYGAKITGDNDERQNANVNAKSFGGRMGEAANVMSASYAFNNVISKMAADNHNNNMIYIHDKDSYAVGMHNCLTIPIDKLAANGVIVRGSKILRPCKSFLSFSECSAVWMQLQSLEQFGGVSYSHYDWSSVPYVRLSFYKHFIKGLKYLYDDFKPSWIPKLTTDEIKNLSIESEEYTYFVKAHKYAMEMTQEEVFGCIEALYHNLNTLQSRSGNQLPFSSINYGTCTLPEGRMVIKALLDNSIAGIGEKHTTSIFPCGIFQCMKGVNRAPGDPNYDLFKLALKSTAQRLYPNYANVDWSGNAGYDRNDPRTYFSTMGCRTANGWDINGFGQLKDGRGNICPVTIIMPTLAMEAKKTFINEYDDSIIDIFLNMLDKKINEAKDMLIERFEHICSQSAESADFMYLNGTMEGYIPEEGIRSALKHGTLAIGNLGLAETLQILIGKDHTTPEGMEIAKHIYQLFANRCAEFKEKYKLNFGVYMTPAENLCYTAMQKFKKKYGTIPNVSDKDFFTNSMHVPVWKEISPFEKIDIESQLTGLSSAGCITYVELDGGVKNNLEALEVIVNYAMDHDIPYFAINVPNDTCLDCGYTDEFNDTCPECGSSNIQQLRRVTGYLTGNYKTAFNNGKQQETEMRVKHQRFNEC